VSFKELEVVYHLVLCFGLFYVKGSTYAPSLIFVFVCGDPASRLEPTLNKSGTPNIQFLSILRKEARIDLHNSLSLLTLLTISISLLLFAMCF
jgi:hypothetical protein